LTPRYGRWRSSTISSEFTLGNEEKGRAMAAETINENKQGLYEQMCVCVG
jgi:hypothetical protein